MPTKPSAKAHAGVAIGIAAAKMALDVGDELFGMKGNPPELRLTKADLTRILKTAIVHALTCAHEAWTKEPRS